MKKALILNVVLLLFISISAAQADWYSHESHIFGTNFNLELWAENRQKADEIVAQVEDEMWRLHHMLSPHEADSELSRINTQAFTQPLAISSEMYTLLSRSLNYSKLTRGAFDPSFSSLGQYYDYRAGVKPDQSLSDEQIKAARKAIDYQLIKLDQDSQTIQLQHPSMKLDLGGIAKGYAMDRAAEILDAQGVSNATVSAGGDMRLLGDKRGRPWVIGIRNPRNSNKSDKNGQQQTAIRLPLENTAVSTSGDYERFFIDEDSGERVHHILDPQTGKSAAKLASVTILGDKGLDTDPLSTSVFVMGAEKGLELINAMPGYDAILIDIKGKVHFSEGLVEP